MTFSLQILLYYRKFNFGNSFYIFDNCLNLNKFIKNKLNNVIYKENLKLQSHGHLNL
jgi:hypothetical protein